MLKKIRYLCVLPLLLLFGCGNDIEDGDASHYKAVQEVAMAYGAQSGLHWKFSQILCYLDKNADHLDKIFNFNALLMPHNIMPPVVAQYGKSYSIESDDVVRLSDKELKMVYPARFVSTAPTWRDYLYIQFEAPEEPPEQLMPHSSYEENIWREAVLVGWEMGIDQATAIFQEALSRLNQDFNGMVLYHILHVQNMISAPYAETTNLGITGDTDGLRFNDKIIKIERPSVLNPQTNQWHPILYDDKA